MSTVQANTEVPEAAERGSDAARTRTFTWADPAPGAAAARGMSGLDYLQAIARGELPRPPIMDTLGIDGGEFSEGRAVFTVLPAEYHYNVIGVVHGGLAATLADSALGCAVHSVLPAGAGYTTLELKINFTRPLTVDTGRVWCEAKVIHAGGRVATAEARVTDADGKLYAHATTTCMIFRPER
jgi:uncharacterized protein (TIGR00369 family)